ncbi:MAG: hypothetical protein IE933_02745 [Sphingomonadales bacterium]|nr:hypothetical protein [Sphingomonadales bacterium]MBD3774520.1 hypothetical protein [Paracoccaceae bacterium]
MKTSATHLRICAASAAAALALIALPAAARDQDQQVSTSRDPDAVDVAKTPITDLNLAKDPIPPVLLAATENPYVSADLTSCDAIGAAIAELDDVLGADFDISEDESSKVSVGRIAQSVVGSLVPFRSIIREISGAADHKREFQRAILAGAVRRGYLKGLGEQKGCAYPARPAFAKLVVPDEDAKAAAKKQDAKTKDAETTEDGVPFVSQPVVQGTR